MAPMSMVTQKWVTPPVVASWSAQWQPDVALALGPSVARCVVAA